MFLVLACTLAAPASRAWADDPRAEAKAHYQSGVKLYASGDYRGAIREFSAAQQIAPADLNNYNLALCYDKLGDAEPAIQYYRSYLDKAPNTDKRAEIEASIARLDAAVKSAGKKLDDKKAAEARAAEEARKAEDARRAEDAKRDDAKRSFDSGAPGPGAGAGAAVGAGSTGTPGAGRATPTGDAQLDRVQQIDINAVRDQRVGGAGSGVVAQPPTGAAGAPPPNGNAMGAAPAPTNGGPAVGAPPPANGAAAANGPGAPGQPDNKDQKKEDPIYKKWWFWAVVAVSGYVVYSIATESSHNSATGRLQPTQRLDQGGISLFRW